MARNPVGKRITPTDDSYDDIWEAWDVNGRPSKFDRMGSWGGALYHVLDITSEQPDFYQTASLQPTLYSDNSASEKPVQRGWWHINRDYMSLKARWTYDGRVKIEKPEIPNRL